jgi:uncharacterized protein
VLRATVDANILVSGFAYQRGKPFQLLKRALEGEVCLTVSQPIINEALDVLSRKFGYPAEDIAETRALISQAARIVAPVVELDVIKEDPDDNRVLECAVSAGADYIVTGDQNLLRLGRYDAIRILTVADFLEIETKHAPGR